MTQSDERLTAHPWALRWIDPDDALDPDSPVPTYVQLASLMRYVIVTAQIPTGTVLPSETELSEAFGVSRDTVRRGYALALRYGAVEVKRGLGHFSTRVRPLDYVALPHGSRVTARHARPSEADRVLSAFGRAVRAPILVVEEPAKPPAIYDAHRTVLSFPDPDGC